MSDLPTPLTDEEIMPITNRAGFWIEVVDADFARDLERKLAEAKESLHDSEAWRLANLEQCREARSKLAEANDQLAYVKGLLATSEKHRATLSDAADHLNNRLREEQAKLAVARDALMKIEERYTDGEDTFDDWRFMGTTAREALARIDKKGTP